MVKLKAQKRGVVLFIVLGTVLLITIMANIILNTISSQSRLTAHQVSRIQAYYAAMAGVNYALEMLRLGPAAGGWAPNTCLAGCNLPPDASIQLPVRIFTIPTGQPGCTNPPNPVFPGGACVNVTINYISP